MEPIASVEIIEPYKKDSGGFRGPKPGHPGKGNVRKKSFNEQKDRDEVYAEVVNNVEELDLFNAADPSVVIVKEKFEHRALAYMRARGMTRKEIYMELGGQYSPSGKPLSGTGKYSYAHLGNIFQQPWFRKRVVTLQHDNGLTGIEAAMTSEQPAAVETIVEIMNDDKAAPQARLAAANSLLDRTLGKPIQRTENKSITAHMQVKQTAEGLREELEILEQELKQQGASV